MHLVYVAVVQNVYKITTFNAPSPFLDNHLHPVLISRTLTRTIIRNSPSLIPTHTVMATATAPGENFEVRQTSSTEDWHPDPSKSIPLSPARQALIDDIIALYSCEPTIERVKRYTPDCVYDDQFVYANDRYKMAGQWFALPKLFKDSKNEGYQVVRSDDEVIQFKNEQVFNIHC